MESFENTLRDQQRTFLELSRLLTVMEEKLDHLLPCSTTPSLPITDSVATTQPSFFTPVHSDLLPIFHQYPQAQSQPPQTPSQFQSQPLSQPQSLILLTR
ncbi:hypothetical protein NE237_011787 [Protea cynaroides]|uniref:Uncharacterized protein n=1 Tax=Protea cynaroides TaxID=273540 RepID=A0A9Q0GWR3_9MAGN|nr:hypothetical protein NE237_011787 [Protea cynaroides]